MSLSALLPLTLRNSSAPESHKAVAQRLTTTKSLLFCVSKLENCKEIMPLEVRIHTQHALFAYAVGPSMMTPFFSDVDGAQGQLLEQAVLAETYSAMSTPPAHTHCEMPTEPSGEVLPAGHALHACCQPSALLYVPGAHP